MANCAAILQQATGCRSVLARVHYQSDQDHILERRVYPSANTMHSLLGLLVFCSKPELRADAIESSCSRVLVLASFQYREVPCSPGRRPMKILLVVGFALLVLGSVAAAKIPEDDVERFGATNRLQWRDGETLTLPVSGGTLSAPRTVKQLVGVDARRALTMSTGASAPSDVEAALFDPRTGEIVFFQKLSPGYVRLDDWGALDLDAALKFVTENAEADNTMRRRSGLPGIHIVGWLEPPNLDRSTNTVRWAIEAAGEHGKPVVTSVALIFGRDGFEKFTWAGKTILDRELLKVAQSSFSFPVGGRYIDYQPGDRIAEYGVADIVAAVLGTKRPPN